METKRISRPEVEVLAKAKGLSISNDTTALNSPKCSVSTLNHQSNDQSQRKNGHA